VNVSQSHCFCWPEDLQVGCVLDSADLCSMHKLSLVFCQASSSGGKRAFTMYMYVSKRVSSMPKFKIQFIYRKYCTCIWQFKLTYFIARHRSRLYSIKPIEISAGNFKNELCQNYPTSVTWKVLEKELSLYCDTKLHRITVCTKLCCYKDEVEHRLINST
jgi:hypothetical protein